MEGVAVTLWFRCSHGQKCCWIAYLNMEHFPLIESTGLASDVVENHALVATIEANPWIAIQYG